MIKAVSCVTFCISDLKKALGSVKKLLIWRIMSIQAVWVSSDEVEIGLIPRLKEKEEASLVLPSVEFTVDDADKVYEHLNDKGVKLTQELHDELWRWRHAALTYLNSSILEIMHMSWEKS
jgi:hypothetical protein